MYDTLVLNDLYEDGIPSRILKQSNESPRAILVRSDTVHTDSFRDLEVVARAGAGYNNISVEDATEVGICVMNTPGANAESVADVVFTTIGMHLRNLHKAIDYVKLIANNTKHIADVIEQEKGSYAGREFGGLTLGVIGLGHIGTVVAKRAQSLGMKVLGFDPFVESSFVAENMVSLEGLLRQSDIISVHIPLSDATRHIIGESELQHTKDDVLLVNFAREGIYDENAIRDALVEKKIGGYITDFPNNAILKCRNVIATPHIGASTFDSVERCRKMATDQVEKYLTYGIVKNSVNFPDLDVPMEIKGNARLVVITKDVPNMIADISAVVGKTGNNINAFHNESNGLIGYNVFDLEQAIEEDQIDTIHDMQNVLRIRSL